MYIYYTRLVLIIMGQIQMKTKYIFKLFLIKLNFNRKKIRMQLLYTKYLKKFIL